MIKETIFLMAVGISPQPEIHQYNPDVYPSYNKTEIFIEADHNSPFKENYEGNIQTAVSGSAALLNDSEGMQIRADKFYQHSQTEYTVVSTYITYLGDQED